MLFVKGIALLSSGCAASFSIEILPLKIRLRPCARNRVAKVGRLSVNAKDAFKSFVERVFANLRQKNFAFERITKFFAIFVNNLSRSIKSFTKRLNRNKCLHCDKIAYVSAYKFLPSPNFSPWPEGKFCECLHRHSTLPSMDYKQNR